MRLSNILSSVFLTIGFSLSAQELGSVEKFDYEFWKDSTSLSELTEKEKVLKGVIIKDYHIRTFLYDSYYSERSGQYIPGIPHEENLYYKRIRLNNDAAVEMYNKVYISNAGGRKVTNLKARAITKDGKIIKFDDSNRKEIENYENLGPFTIFALEGIEVGSEIEYTYTTKERADNFYFSKSVQGSFPKREFHFEIVSPKNLIFKTKSYNGIPELIQDSTAVEENRYVVHVDSVKAFKEEKYSLGDALQQRIEAKLFENTENNQRNFYSWSEAATEYSNYIYSSKDPSAAKKEQKAIKKFLKANKLNKVSDVKETVIALEHLIKSKFEFVGQGPFTVNDVIEKGQYTKFSATRMMAQMLKYLDIEHQVVITSNRFETTFDPDFETYNYLGTFLIYFPQLDQFIDPTSEFMRLGLIPSNYAYTKGLFLKMVEIGGVVSAFPEIRDIKGTNSDVNFDNLTVHMKFAEDFEKIVAHMKHEVSGYSAAYLRPVMPYLDDERKKEVLEERLKQIGEDAIISNIQSINEKMEGYMLGKPYVFEGDAEVESLIESAGNKYLLKIGQIIGPQVEMYQDKTRKFGVENVYNHGYLRKINIEIPEGYKVTNLDDLNMDYFSKKGDKRVMEFTSKYELKGNKLSIICNEFYDEIRLPVEKFEEFRTVINAAADFNKITLVLEKK